MNKEEWRPIPGYVGLYEISNFGNARSLKFGKTKYLTPRLNKSTGYYEINLRRNNKVKMCKIHKLVWLAFKGYVSSKIDIDHIDGCRTNNNLSNLRPLSRRDNVQAGQDRKRAAGNTSSEFRGVSSQVDKGIQYWRVSATLRFEKIYIGIFKSKIEGFFARIAAEEYGIFPQKVIDRF